MASQNLPDLTVAEYNSRSQQIGSRLPYYSHILRTVAPTTARGMPISHVQQLIRAETNRYIAHGPAHASQPVSIHPNRNTARNTVRHTARNISRNAPAPVRTKQQQRTETRKRKRNNSKKVANSQNRTKRARFNNANANNSNANNSNNNLFYKANVTGYIPALNLN